MDADEFRRAWDEARAQEWLDRFRKFIRVGLLPGVGIILLLILIFSTYFTVQPDEIGVVTRFGAIARRADPGLHFKWPWGIEDVELVKTQRVYKEEFGFRTVEPGVRTRYAAANYEHESLMLTGDLNIADVEWIVQYRIADPMLYLFRIRSPEQALRDASEAVMREVVGDHSVTEVLTSGRAGINDEVIQKLQKVLDQYESGLKIVAVKLQNVNPPESVKAAFNEVNEAKQEKEKTINQAWEAYNKAVPEARGQAEQTVAEAEGFKIDRINRALGDTERFASILAEYEKAPDITRARLYLETMRRVLPQVQRKILTDSGGSGLLPLLHFNAEPSQ